MGRVTVAQQNWSGGELSEDLRGRWDLGVYYNGTEWMQNFIATVQGMARFRSGTKYAWSTRDNQVCRLIEFEFNVEQAYALEFTDLKIRIYKDGGIVTQAPQAISGITKANPAVVTYVGADNYANGDRVILAGVVGMTQVNNQEFIVANVNTGANTFELQGIDSTGFTTYVSGGTVAEIVEVTTPYTTADVADLDYTQTTDTMYLVNENHAPRKLTRSSHTSWTLSTFDIVSNPFGTTKAAALTITAATQANPCVITSAAHGLSNGDIIYIDSVVGMTQLNKKNYTVRGVAANTFQLEAVDSTTYTAYTSGGTAAKFTAFSYPSVVCFFEQRLLYASSATYQQRLWGSQAGFPDDFRFGTGDSDAFQYNVASGKANRIRWMVGTEDFLAIGSAGSEFKASGGGTNDAISPTNVSIKPVSSYGSSDIKPIKLDSHIMYIQRDAMTTRTFEFDAIQDGYTSINRNITSNTITHGRYGRPNGLKQLAYQAGESINWAARNDGILVGLTFEPREQVNGWHRHKLGGKLLTGKQLVPEVESVCSIPQDQSSDQLYICVHRTVNGQSVRHIEYFADQPTIPRSLDYYTGNKEADTDAYLQDLWEAQKRLHYVDSGVTYDGSIYATQDLTLSLATKGTGRTITASGAIFDITMVNKEIWGKRGGRAKITGYTDPTTVTVKITVDFPDTSLVIGDWYLTAITFGGLQHLIGEEVVALADGGVVEGLVVDSLGEVTLAAQASYVTVGLRYVGIWKSMDIEGGGNNGPAQTKKRSISTLGVKFLDTLGAKFGTDIYKLDRVNFRSTADIAGRPAPLFSGVKPVDIRDDWEEEKHVYCVQDKPLPCNVQLVMPNMTTNDG